MNRESIDRLVYTSYLQLRGFEIIKAIHLDPVGFTLERDLVTPTFKLKRPELLKYYKVIRSTSMVTRLYMNQ